MKNPVSPVVTGILVLTFPIGPSIYEFTLAFTTDMGKTREDKLITIRSVFSSVSFPLDIELVEPLPVNRFKESVLLFN